MQRVRAGAHARAPLLWSGELTTGERLVLEFSGRRDQIHQGDATREGRGARPCAPTPPTSLFYKLLIHYNLSEMV